ncbi:MAG TPA: hypothetical protein VMZ33_00230 [Candidatus Limnocylindrales bacterium]|nr:hypothetical protein [Candidatus Limnocylindrales bacterium]
MGHDRCTSRGAINSVGRNDAHVLSRLRHHETDAGMPESQPAKFTVVGRMAALETRLHYNVVYRFSNVGDATTIEAPRL